MKRKQRPEQRRPRALQARLLAFYREVHWVGFGTPAASRQFSDFANSRSRAFRGDSFFIFIFFTKTSMTENSTEKQKRPRKLQARPSAILSRNASGSALLQVADDSSDFAFLTLSNIKRYEKQYKKKTAPRTKAPKDATGTRPHTKKKKKKTQKRRHTCTP